jgi:hypothetical protein
MRLVRLGIKTKTEDKRRKGIKISTTAPKPRPSAGGNALKTSQLGGGLTPPAKK